MKIKIKTTQLVEEEFEVSIPYYFADYDNDGELHGVITEQGVTTIRVSKEENESTVEIAHSSNPNEYAGYIRPQYTSNREKFEKAITFGQLLFRGLLTVKLAP